MTIFRPAGMAAAVFMLAACAAPRMENLKNPGADLRVDTAACQRDAERVVKLEQLARPVVPNACYGCQTQANREMQDALNAQGMQKRCMAARGWRPVS
jgi:hypothetical protein